MILRRGEVWWVQLDPTLGSEIKKTRPCVIMTSNVANDRRRTVVVIPLSSSPSPNPPLLVPVECDGRRVVAVTDQIRAVSKERIGERFSVLREEDLAAIEDGLKEVLELA